jgi:hypothetical protein
MKKRIFAIAFTSALVWMISASITYADDSTYDPRALAMGGTGVTTSNTRNAAFQNPAMLAALPRDSFAWEFPIVTVRLQDQNNLLSAIDQLKIDASNLTATLRAFNANPTSLNTANATSAANVVNKFNNSLTPVSNKTLMADLFAGTMFGMPSKKFAFSLYVTERAEVGALFSYAAADQTTLSNLATDLTNCAGGNNASCVSAYNANNNGQINNLQSRLLVRGVTIKELGITIAHHFEGKGLELGFTPKTMQLDTYDYALKAQQTNNITLDQGKQSYNALNMDVGASKSFQAGSVDEIKTGMVVKNMFPKSFTTILGSSINIKPQVVVGVSYLTRLTTAGIDLDVIPNQPVINGFSKESQYLRLGAEFDAWRWAQVRIGYRHDLKGNYPDLPSVGLGLSPFGIHFDIAAARTGDKEAAVSVQAGFSF